MKRVLILLTIPLWLLSLTPSYGREVPFTQEDRDRLIRLEEGLKALDRRIDEGLKAVNERINDLQTFMLWGFGILFGGMGILIGFVIWDRRTALSPVVRKNRELEERQEKVERALKELARRNPEVEEVLRDVRLL